jgi:hypothetical protein
MSVKFGEKIMNKNQRRNRPNKKVMPESDWERKLRELKEGFEYGGGKKS